MAWTTPTAATTGELITAARWNTDVKDNPIALRSGAIALASQAAQDFLYASSATQFARLPPVDGRVPKYTTAGGWAMAAVGDLSARVYHNTTQSITTGTPTLLNFNSERHDIGTLHDNATNNSRLTVPTGGNGVWLFLVNVKWANASATQRAVELLRNGSVVSRVVMLHPNPYDGAMQTSAMLEMVATDYCEVRVHQDSGGPVAVGTGFDDFHWFAGTKLW